MDDDDVQFAHGRDFSVAPMLIPDCAPADLDAKAAALVIVPAVTSSWLPRPAVATDADPRFLADAGNVDVEVDRYDTFTDRLVSPASGHGWWSRR